MHNMKKQALISCSDKSGVVEFAKALTELGYHILSTGGTAKLIAQAGIPVQEVADYTGFPEMLDEYDVIYLGYPNYWSTMPMAVFTFLEHFDFSGKTIKPFCIRSGAC